MTDAEKDKLTLSYVNEVFNPLRMYEYFLVAIENYPGDEMAKRNREALRDDLGELVFDMSDADEQKIVCLTPLSTVDYADEYIMKLVGLSTNSIKPIYELDKEMIKRLKMILKKLYPEMYNTIRVAESRLWARSNNPLSGSIKPPKETLLAGHKKNPK